MSYRFMRRLNNIEKAVKLVEDYLKNVLRVLRISVDEAFNKYAAEEVYSPTDVPPYDRAVVDGCAVKASDLGGASPESPVVLVKKGALYAGDEYSFSVEHGYCVEVATGSILPRGADTVVPAEYIITKKNDEYVRLVREFNPGYGISFRGEDIRKGDIIVERGARLKEHHIAMLSSVGLKYVEVWDLPRIAVFSTGNEIVEPGEEKTPSKIYDSTRRIVIGFLKRMGFNRISDMGIIADDEKLIENAYMNALETAEIVISTGGTSVGKKDTTIRVLEKLKPEEFIHGFALTPGRPFGVGLLGGKLVLALSGMPVAALTELMAVLEPALARALGRNRSILPIVKGVLTRKLVTHTGMMNYVRARVHCSMEGRILVDPLRLTGSGILSTLKDGNAVIPVPPDVTGFNEGDTVDVIIYDPDNFSC